MSEADWSGDSLNFREARYDWEFLAEIDPAPAWRRPWPGYWSRWWFEIAYRPIGSDETWTTVAYERGGSGGAFTLRRCLWKASAAIWVWAKKLEAARAAAEGRG